MAEASMYRWKPGTSIGVAAPVAAAELDRIREENEGVLRASDVVKESRPDEAPLHPAFEWDDEKAAELYRQNQARNVIRSLTVVQTDKPNAPAMPVYLHVAPKDDAKGQQYLPTMEVMGDEELRNRAIMDAIAQLKGWQKRYGHIRELAGVVDAIRETAAEVGSGVLAGAA